MMRRHKIPIVIFTIFLTANFLFWMHSHHVQAEWGNIPPAPKLTHAGIMSLGDKQLAYRANTIMLQNFGNSGGRSVSFKEYDYNNLKEWFFLQDSLDPRSNAVPMMATYYFGGVKDKEKIYHILDYLAVVGRRPYGEKWRWLGHGVNLARYELNDTDKALELAYLLAANKDPDLADWAKQMPAFVLRAQGNTRLAYDIMLNILISNIDTLHPNEIFYMRDYICNTLLPEDKSITPPVFCRDL